jgi:hypothetical protein
VSSHRLGPVEGIGFLTSRATRRSVFLGVSFGALCLLLWTGSGLASQLDFTPMPTNEILLAQRAISDTEDVQMPAEAPPVSSLGTPPPLPAEVHKSAGRAFIYNVLLPGAGHLYAGNDRGWAHLGLEGVAWATYFYYHERGTSKEDEYKDHADDHWDYTRWISSCNCTGSPEDSLIVYFRNNNRQHYYEDIVKLNTYAGGWDDQANRNFNRGMRNDSNNFLKNARYAVVGSFVNRIVSAVDVLRILKRRAHSVLGEDTQLRFKVRTKPFADHTAVGFEIRKKL